MTPGPIEWHRFHRRYGPAVRERYDERTRRLGRTLRRQLGHRRVLGLALVPQHDETTVWWFEQSVLAVLKAAGWHTTWVTDTSFGFDEARLYKLPGELVVSRVKPGASVSIPNKRFDAVLSLYPTDVATCAALARGIPLVAFAIKNLYAAAAAVVTPPPPGTRLWHAFAGSTNFVSAARATMPSLASWELVGAPFPVCHAYFPACASEPDYDALIFGSQQRQLGLAFAALARAGVERVAALVSEDKVAVEGVARLHGIAADVFEPLPHLDLLALLERTRIVLNPIVPPAESHYSLSVPLALGRPILASDIPAVAPFVGPGLRVASLRDEGAWTEQIRRLLEETRAGVPHRGALRQGLERHDAERFFASAILKTLLV